MNNILDTLAKKKWFVPLVLLLMLIIALTSFADFSPNSEGDTALTTEEQLESLCNSVKGVQNAKVMITYEAVQASTWGGGGSSQEKILGIAVVCDGGDDPTVQLALHNMIKALFDISATRITISQRNPA